jgi:hypothetical protein
VASSTSTSLELNLSSDAARSLTSSNQTDEWNMLPSHVSFPFIKPPRSTNFERSIQTFSSPSEVLNWLSSYNIRLPELDHFQAPFPMSALDTPYTCLRHIYAAACLHSLSLEVSILTPAMIIELHIFALEQETRAIEANRIENPPPAITALAAFFFAWTQLWQRSWDSGVPHLRQALNIVSARPAIGLNRPEDNLMDEVGAFLECFARCIPKVLQCKKAMQAMPETRLDESMALCSSGRDVKFPTYRFSEDFKYVDAQINYANLSDDLSNYGLPQSMLGQQAAARHPYKRLAYVVFHAHRALLWATGAYAETSRLVRLPISRPANPIQGVQGSTLSFTAQAQHIRALLTVLHAKLSALLSVWAVQGTGQLELPSELQDLESPFTACMKHLSLFLGRKAGFDLQLWEGQCRLSVKFACLFAAGAGEEREVLRADVLGVLRRGVEVRRNLGLDGERKIAMLGSQSAQAAYAIVSDVAGSNEVQWIHTDGLS